MVIPGMTPRCDICGSEDWCAAAPGTEPDTAGDLFIISRGEPMRVWCMEHWPNRPKPQQETTHAAV